MICPNCELNNRRMANFCSGCGFELERPEPEIESPTTQNKDSAVEHPVNKNQPGLFASNLNCPICGKIDQVQKVKTIIASGTSSTSGLGAGMPLGAVGDLASLGVGGFFASTSTSLTDELQGEGIPNGWGEFWSKGLRVLLAALVIQFSVVMLITGELIVGTLAIWYGWWIPVLIGVFVGLYYKNKLENEVIAPVREIWAACKTRLNEARFCYRDGVIFDETFHGDTPVYLAEIFSPMRKEMERLEKEGIVKWHN